MLTIAGSRVRGWARVAEAGVLLTAAAAAQRWVPMTRWSRLLGEAGEVPPSWRGRTVTGLPVRAQSAQEAQVVGAIRRAQVLLPWHISCLAQAGAGQVMLRRRGSSGVVVIGLRRNESQSWDAHAWLLGGHGALTGGAAAQGFTAATVYEVAGRMCAGDVSV